MSQDSQQSQISPQKVIHITKQQQMEMEEITQMMTQDLMNVTGILAETQSVYQVFSKDKQHQMIPVFYNRCALQMSLSNGIHKDMVETTKDPVLKKHLIEQRQKYKTIFDRVKDQLTDQNELIDLVKIHSENTINKQIINFCTYESKPTSRQPQFNIKVVEEIFKNMAIQDQLQADILSGKRKADVIDEELVIKTAKYRANLAVLKSFLNNYLQQVSEFVNNLQEEQKQIIQLYFKREFTQKLEKQHLQNLNKEVWPQDNLIHLFHKDVECKLDILSYFQLFCMNIAVKSLSEQAFFDEVSQFVKNLIYVEVTDEIDSFNMEYQKQISIYQQLYKEQQKQIEQTDQTEQKEQQPIAEQKQIVQEKPTSNEIQGGQEIQQNQDEKKNTEQTEQQPIAEQKQIVQEKPTSNEIQEGQEIQQNQDEKKNTEQTEQQPIAEQKQIVQEKPTSNEIQEGQEIQQNQDEKKNTEQTEQQPIAEQKQIVQEKPTSNEIQGGQEIQQNQDEKKNTEQTEQQPIAEQKQIVQEKPTSNEIQEGQEIQQNQDEKKNTEQTEQQPIAEQKQIVQEKPTSNEIQGGQEIQQNQDEKKNTEKHETILEGDSDIINFDKLDQEINRMHEEIIPNQQEMILDDKKKELNDANEQIKLEDQQ